MITVYSEDHRLHEGRQEFHRGKMHPCFERPERADLIIQRIRQENWEILSPEQNVDLGPLHHIHRPRYLSFLESIHGQWHTEHPEEDAIAHVWSCRGMRQVEPESIYGKLGFYSFDAGTPITAGTWRAALAAVRTALTAQQLVDSERRAVFALTRPPGHHAGSDFCGGYCFCNNAAIAAEAFLHAGAERVAILDVDFHHGNGTQSIFYERSDVLFVSLHGDEAGRGMGKGFNVNYPLPPGTDWKRYRSTLLTALGVVGQFRPQRLIVSLGVDTFVGDPISTYGFRLTTEDFVDMGRVLATNGLPTLFVMEGGYYPQLGETVFAVLAGFDEAGK